MWLALLLLPLGALQLAYVLQDPCHCAIPTYSCGWSELAAALLALQQFKEALAY